MSETKRQYQLSLTDLLDCLLLLSLNSLLLVGLLLLLLLSYLGCPNTCHFVNVALLIH